MRTSAIFGAKNVGFFKIYGVSARTKGDGELSQCEHFSDKGADVIKNFFKSDIVFSSINNTY